jgi:hypothetical protein
MAKPAHGILLIDFAPGGGSFPRIAVHLSPGRRRFIHHRGTKDTEIAVDQYLRALRLSVVKSY